MCSKRKHKACDPKKTHTAKTVGTDFRPLRDGSPAYFNSWMRRANWKQCIPEPGGRFQQTHNLGQARLQQECTYQNFGQVQRDRCMDRRSTTTNREHFGPKALVHLIEISMKKHTTLTPSAHVKQAWTYALITWVYAINQANPYTYTLPPIPLPIPLLPIYRSPPAWSRLTTFSLIAQ